MTRHQVMVQNYMLPIFLIDTISLFYQEPQKLLIAMIFFQKKYLKLEMDETSAEEQASESPSAVCPVCGKENNVLNHINKSKKCKEKVTEKQLED